jgi:hypothetical protein
MFHIRTVCRLKVAGCGDGLTFGTSCYPRIVILDEDTRFQFLKILLAGSPVCCPNPSEQFGRFNGKRGRILENRLVIKCRFTAFFRHGLMAFWVNISNGKC